MKIIILLLIFSCSLLPDIDIDLPEEICFDGTMIVQADTLIISSVGDSLLVVDQEHIIEGDTIIIRTCIQL